MIHTNRLFWLAQLFLWASFGLLTRFTWLDTYPPSWSWIVCYMGLGFVFASSLAYFYPRLRHCHTLILVIVSVIGSILLGLLWRVSFNAIEYHVLESANNQFKFWGYFHNGKSAVAQLLIWSFGYWLIATHFKLQAQAKERQQLELDAKEAQLKMLQYQIAPHFLFNVMSSIDTLLLKNDVVTARNTLNKLSAYLRQTLTNDTTTSLTLEQELTLCQRYLDLERVRFNDKLELNWRMPETLPNCEFPPGILQPIIENALKHGGLSQAESSLVDVTLTCDDTMLCLTIGNHVPEDAPNSKGFGLGLQNTKERLHRFFGNKAKLSTELKEKYFKAELRVQLS